MSVSGKAVIAEWLYRDDKGALFVKQQTTGASLSLRKPHDIS